MTIFKYLLAIICYFGFTATINAANYEDKQINITDRLVSDGFENVRVIFTDENHISATIEDNHYHSFYHGIAQALRIIGADEEDKEIELIVLEDNSPRITIKAILSNKNWDIPDVKYGGSLSRELKQIENISKSSFKADIVLYPDYGLSNDRFDRLWSAHFALDPALEMTLWKGSHITMQAHLPIWDNYSFASHYGYKDKVTIKRLSIIQQLINNNKWSINTSAGLFDQNRAGMELRAAYHINNNLDIGVKTGYTGPWNFNNNVLRVGYLNKFNILGYGRYYETNTNLELLIDLGQYVYQDRGIRISLYRHYADYIVGLNYCSTNYGHIMGLAFSAPIGPKKMGKHRAIRVRAPRCIDFSIDEVTRIKEEYSEAHFATMYSAHPEYNKNSHFWQPEYLRKYILKDLHNNNK